MHPISLIATQLAVLFIAGSGIAVVLRQRTVALRLFLAGAVIASASAITAMQIQSDTYAAHLAEIAVCFGVVGVIALNFGAKRLAVYCVTPTVLLLAVVMAWPVVQSIMTALAPYLWIVPVVLVVPVIAFLIVSIWLKSLRNYTLGFHPTHSLGRLLSRVLDRLTGGRRHRRRPDRYIAGATRRDQRAKGGKHGR